MTALAKVTVSVSDHFGEWRDQEFEETTFVWVGPHGELIIDCNDGSKHVYARGTWLEYIQEPSYDAQ